MALWDTMEIDRSPATENGVLRFTMPISNGRKMQRKNAFRYYCNFGVYAYYCAVLLRAVSPFIVSL